MLRESNQTFDEVAIDIIAYCLVEHSNRLELEGLAKQDILGMSLPTLIVSESKSDTLRQWQRRLKYVYMDRRKEKLWIRALMIMARKVIGAIPCHIMTNAVHWILVEMFSTRIWAMHEFSFKTTKSDFGWMFFLIKFKKNFKRKYDALQRVLVENSNIKILKETQHNDKPKTFMTHNHNDVGLQLDEDNALVVIDNEDETS